MVNGYHFNTDYKRIICFVVLTGEKLNGEYYGLTTTVVITLYSYNRRSLCYVKTRNDNIVMYTPWARRMS